MCSIRERTDEEAPSVHGSVLGDFNVFELSWSDRLIMETEYPALQVSRSGNRFVDALASTRLPNVSDRQELGTAMLDDHRITWMLEDLATRHDFGEVEGDGGGVKAARRSQLVVSCRCWDRVAQTESIADRTGYGW